MSASLIALPAVLAASLLGCTESSSKDDPAKPFPERVDRSRRYFESAATQDSLHREYRETIRDELRQVVPENWESGDFRVVAAAAIVSETDRRLFLTTISTDVVPTHVVLRSGRQEIVVPLDADAIDVLRKNLTQNAAIQAIVDIPDDSAAASLLAKGSVEATVRVVDGRDTNAGWVEVDVVNAPEPD